MINDGERKISEKILRSREWNVNVQNFVSCGVFFKAQKDELIITIYSSYCWKILVAKERLLSANRQDHVKARPHCKSPGQIGGATWPSGLVEQLKKLRCEW